MYLFAIIVTQHPGRILFMDNNSFHMNINSIVKLMGKMLLTIFLKYEYNNNHSSFKVCKHMYVCMINSFDSRWTTLIP